MRVDWTDHAKQQLAAIHDHIALDSERYALRVVDRLTRRSKQIARFPKSGRKVPELEREDIREVIETPYGIVYRILARGRLAGGRGKARRRIPHAPLLTLKSFEPSDE